MSESLRREIRQTRPFASREEEVLLELQRTANVVDQALLHFFRRWDLTPTQYNVLRILRGARPGDLPCREVGDRMVTAVPDVTRLLDRLEVRDLVERRRDASDRRVVRAAVTRPGLELLADIDAPLQELVGRLLGPLGAERLADLEQLLEETRCAALAADRDRTTADVAP